MAPNSSNKRFHADIVPAHNSLVIDSNYDLSNMPEEVLRMIFQFLNFDTITYVRLVCHKFNLIGKSMLNFEFRKLQKEITKRYQFTLEMPRQVPLSCKRQVITYLSEEFYKLQRLFGKHLSDGCCCFFAGKLLDEICNALRVSDTCDDQLEVVISLKSLPKALKILNRYYILYRKLFNYLQSDEHFHAQNEGTQNSRLCLL